MLTPQTNDHPKSPAWLNYTIILLVLLVGVWALWEMAFKAPTQVSSSAVELPANRGRGAFNPGGGRGTQAPAVNITPTTRFANQRGRNNNAGFQNPVQNTPVTPVSAAELERRNAITYNNRDGAFAATWGDTTLSAAIGRNAINSLIFDYKSDIRMGWITKDEQLLHLAAYRGTQTANGGGLNLTRDQKDQLDNLRYRPHLTDEEQTKLRQLVTAWYTAWANAVSPADPAWMTARDALLDYMTQLGKDHLEQTKDDFQNRVKTIPTILTAEQLQQVLGKKETAVSGEVEGPK
jgi:hypothetical protein